MAGPDRPRLDVTGTLDRHEWLELHRTALRRTPFPLVIATAAALTAVSPLLAAVLGAPTVQVLAASSAILGMLTAFGAGSVWVGPALRFRKVPAEHRTARWRVSAEQLRTEIRGTPLELEWQDVDRVRVTRRLITFELTAGRGLLALPRRTATELGETLILGWAGCERTRN